MPHVNVFTDAPYPDFTAPEPAAPNAANAAPLMPECWRCKGTGMYESYAGYDGPCSICDGTGRERGSREGFPAIIRPGHLGADEQLPAYAWPGGYPLAYYPCTYSPPFDKILKDGTPYHGGEHAETVGDVVCADCATAELHTSDGPGDDLCFISNIEEEVSDHNLTCDNCTAVIAYQTYCHDCGESVDCDEDTPFHLCPATEPYTVRYLTQVPGTDWHEYSHCPSGPDEARALAREVQYTKHAAFVHYQPSRLDFPPVVEEE